LPSILVWVFVGMFVALAALLIFWFITDRRTHRDQS
jgi:hypothetical protein